MTAGCELMTWYLWEASRLSGSRPAPEHQNAVRLLNWLRSKRKGEVTRSEIMQFGPAPLRTKAATDAAMSVLEEHRHAVPAEGASGRWKVTLEAAE